MKKRIAAILTAMVMAVSLLPVQALAADDVPPGTPEVVENIQPPETAKPTDGAASTEPPEAYANGEDAQITPLYGDAGAMRMLAAAGSGDDYEISISNAAGQEVPITSGNQDDVLGDGTVKFAYDAALGKGTLTLENATLRAVDEYPINASRIDILEIVLKGENLLEAEDGDCILAKDLIFSGDGRIRIVTSGYYVAAIDLTGGLTVNGGVITVQSINYGIAPDGAIAVHGGVLTITVADEYGTAVDKGWDPLAVTLGAGMAMFTADDPNGVGAQRTAASEVDVFDTARYVQIAGEHIHCLCGAAHDTGDGDHQNVEWRVWTVADALPSAAGSYYLAGDVVLAAAQQLSADVRLCLNGKTISVNGSTAFSGGSMLGVSGTAPVSPVLTNCRADGGIDAGTAGIPAIAVRGESTLQLRGSIAVEGAVAMEGKAGLLMTDEAGIGGDLLLTPAAGDSLRLDGEHVYIGGSLRCSDPDSAAAFTVAPGSEVHTGGIDLPCATLMGRYVCSGEIKSGVFDANGAVVNNGVITGGIFYGAVTGSGVIADSAKAAVTFETGGGSAVDTQYILRGQKAVEPAAPSRIGWLPNGWSSGGSAYDFGTPVVNALTLTAQWTACDHAASTDKPSCTKEAVCTVCGGVMPALGHTLRHEAAHGPGFYITGNIEYWYCTRCGKYFADAAASKEISQADTVIPGMGRPDRGETVQAPATGDAGAALYGVTALLSLTGCGWLRRRGK